MGQAFIDFQHEDANIIKHQSDFADSDKSFDVAALGINVNGNVGTASEDQFDSLKMDGVGEAYSNTEIDVTTRLAPQVLFNSLVPVNASRVRMS